MSSSNIFDTIVIGSGVGGLAAAICLAREGQRVLVLEQHDVPGGWCHSFYIDGHRFSPGVHYIGALGEGESTAELFEGLGIANDLTFFRMNPEGYEHCWIGDHRIDLPAGLDALKERLIEQFPHEEKGIEAYLNVVQKVSTELQLIPNMKGFWDHLTIPWRTRHLGKYGLFSLEKVISRFIKDPLLKQVLNVQCGDHGLSPDKVSFPFHCAVMEHYFQGGYYPMGGGGAIVKAMTNAIKAHGSVVKTRQFVERILIEGQKKKVAIGVQLRNGEQIFAKRIISNADPSKTYIDLVGAENISQKLQQKLARTKYSCTSLMLFLTVKMDLTNSGIDSGNIWVFPEQEMNTLFEEMMDVDLLKTDTFPAFFVSCTTIKDPTSYDGQHHSFEAITFINPTSFDAFQNEKEKRSQAYLDFKEQLTLKLMTGMEKIVPGISSHVVHKKLGTPLTNEHYINVTKGSVYGTQKTLKQIGPFAFKSTSEINNLFLCGASILAQGIAGAAHSGVQTAAQIVGCSPNDFLKKNHHQRITTVDVETVSQYPEHVVRKIQHKQSRNVKY